MAVRNFTKEGRSGSDEKLAIREAGLMSNTENEPIHEENAPVQEGVEVRESPPTQSSPGVQEAFGAQRDSGLVPRAEAGAGRGRLQDPVFWLQFAALLVLSGVIVRLIVAGSKHPESPAQKVNAKSVKAPSVLVAPPISELRSEIRSRFDFIHAHEDDGDFSRAVVRMTRAFKSFPGREPEEIVQSINSTRQDAGAPCAILWSAAGEPALMFGNGNFAVSPVAVLNRCAVAVEQVRARTAHP